MKKVSFHGRILVLGAGGVSRCTLPLVLKHLDMPAENITVMDMMDAREGIADSMKQGVKFVQEKIEKDSMGKQLSAHVGKGDMIIDLAWNIGATDILQWCHDNDVLYINTSVELWDPYTDAHKKDAIDRTLYPRHMAIREMTSKWNKKGATAILEHGANPGLVSHFTKMALTDIATEFLRDKPDDPRRTEIEQALATHTFNRLSQLLGVKVIHISEIDTQVSSIPHDPNVFANTWSVEGFREEGIAPSEMGWGTHEKTLPVDGKEHVDGPKNQICLERFGIDTYVRSRVPSREITGMVVRHGESFTMSDYLTVWDKDKAIYRPTVHYAYCPSIEAWESLSDMKAANYTLQDSWRIMGDDITSGEDELGVLLMGHDYESWWTGTVLSIEETRALVPHQNATTLQVAASVIAAVTWMICHPEEGVLVPDQLPHEEIMAVASPYLGKIPSMKLNWTPTGKPATGDDTWQFGNFLLKGKNQHLRALRVFSMPGKKVTSKTEKKEKSV
jgi:homospermidine synthase